MRAFLVPVIALSMVLFGTEAANAGCVLHQDTARICTEYPDGIQSCQTTIYNSLVCAGDSGGGGVSGGGSGSGGGGGGTSGPDLTSSQRQAVESAMTLAIDRLNSLAKCARMYTELTLLMRDGMSILKSSEYVNGSSTLPCQVSPNIMWTIVGSNVIQVCHGVPNLRRIDNAMLVLHESLHTAGQYESPGTPGAPSSADISGYVRDRCNLH